MLKNYPTSLSDIQKIYAIWFRDLSLTIHEGEKVAIIGEGNGKSSLLQVLMSSKSLPDYLITEGEMTTSFHSLPIFPPRRCRKHWRGKPWRIFFFGEDELDYASLYRLADQLQFNSDRFATPKLSEVYLEEKPSKVQLLHELLLSSWIAIF